MTQQLSDMDTMDVEIIAAATGMPEATVVELATEAADIDGLSVSEELDDAVEELIDELVDGPSDVDSDDDDTDNDDTVWGFGTEA